MNYPRATAVLLSSIATLSLMTHAPGTRAQVVRPMPARPAPAAPVQSQIVPLPERIALPWVFANIRVSLVGPQIVKIDWMPLPNANQYDVYRNQIKIGPSLTVPPNASQPLSFTDTSAPPASSVTYFVRASQPASTPEVAVGQPLPKNQPPLLNYERFMADSSSVAILTQAAAPAAASGAWQPFLAARRAVVPLQGFVDLHAHPMSYLGFGGRLLYGAPDFVDPSKDPADMLELPPALPGCNPNSGYATSEDQALGHESDFYGGPNPPPPFGPLLPIPNPCVNPARETLILGIQASLLLTQAQWPPNSFRWNRAPTPPNPLWSGPPYWPTWPAWNDALRQNMYVDWIRRAYDGGLRIMVALAVNSKLLGDVVQVFDPNKNAEAPTDDLRSADLQISELHRFVSRHANFNGRPWMTIVRSSTELHQAVANNQLAIVVGMEIDNIGNLGTVAGQTVTAKQLTDEIDRLYAEDVRYIFPVHLVDNPIGKSAAYDPTFTFANLYEEHAVMHLSCAQPGDNIQWDYNAALQKISYLFSSGLPGLGQPTTTNCGNLGVINAGDLDSTGQVIGLSPLGKIAIQHMMDKGMLIDVDHMSQASVTNAIALAKTQLPVNYPLFSGHNNLRTSAGPGSFKERQLTNKQYSDLGSLHSMAGIGAANTDAQAWIATLSQTVNAMNVGNLPVIAFGTDADGLEFMMPPRRGSAVNPAAHLPPPAIPLSLSRDGARTWDYNANGVAHYGLLPDFLLDVGSILPNGPTVVTQMFNGAQTFYDSWYLAELDKKL